MPTKGWIVIKFVACFGKKEPDASTKSQLSFVCKRVKQKFSDAGMNEEIITTSWEKGIK